MNHEQIKARCIMFLSANMSTDGRVVRPKEFHLRIESLYREAMAKGLEIAAMECEKRRMLCAAAAQPYAENGWREKKILLDYLSEWCFEQASKMKETT